MFIPFVVLRENKELKKMANSNNKEIDNKTLQQRKDLLQDLVTYLVKVTDDDLSKNTVEEITEGFWMIKQKAALDEIKPFQMSGD